MVEIPPARNGTSTGAGPAPDAPVDVRRVVAAIRRDRRLILAIVLLVSGLVLVVSLLSPPRYRANARIADASLTTDAVDTATSDRRLATSRALVTTPEILGDAARRLPGESAGSLAGKVTATVDPAASILDIAVSDGDPRRAARIANAVATTFLAESERSQQLALTQAQERMSSELETQRRRGASAATIDALRARLADTAAARVIAGPGLRVVESASVPARSYAPRPLRSTALALLAALLVAVLIAVARDRLRRQGPDAQALSRELDVPLIAALPVGGPRHRRPGGAAIDGAVIEEAALQAAVRAALPPRAQRVVLVHGFGRHANAAAVAGALARSLSWSGHATVLVRVGAPGDWAPRAADVPVVACADLEEQLRELKESDYRYVIVQSPETGAGPQLRRIASDTGGVVLVARLGEATTDDAMAARRLVEALALHGLGLVITCSASETADIARSGFAAPPRPRPRSRSRGGSPNGTHAAAGDEAAEQPEAPGPPR
jgi:capsular polysaccharide biosynthesis protein